ncbi:hypothetical protein EIP91_011433 [Steccherinum ochraceum]|uniref:Rho-GAP domain-containing protein n=1 Tax=Steccherinum ochraceum TaxID=92696 RepID=A0A4R0RPS6_9APHY|nr:hypothetical protein EIP91_011433 [Steccherinum ochraceum]
MDTESYRLAKACGQDALSASASSPAGWAFSGSGDSSPSSRCDPSTDVRSVDSVGCASSPRRGSRGSPPPLPPPQFPHPDIVTVLRSLKGELRKSKTELTTMVDPDALFEEVRDKERDKTGRQMSEDPRVFGVPLTELSDLAMCMATNGSYQYEVPAVVAGCVEQLYRTGIYQHDLFRALPDREKLQSLVAKFDQPSRLLGSQPSCTSSFTQETMPNLCALLVSYVNALPRPLMPRNLFDALWVCHWTVLLESFEDAGFDREPEALSGSDNSGRRQSLFASETESDESDASPPPSLPSGRRPSILRNGQSRVRRAVSDRNNASGTRRVSFSDPPTEDEDSHANNVSAKEPSDLRQQLQLAVTERDHARNIVKEISSIVERYPSL